MEALRGLARMTELLDTAKDRTARKLAKAGVNAALTPLAAAMRAAVNAAPVSAEMKAAARKTIAKRLKKKEGQPTTGKAGFAVGKRTARKAETAHQRNMRGQGDRHEVAGVGISAANVHWPVLGTGERTSARGPTGKMPALLAGLLDGATSTAAPAMLAAARKKVSEVLASEIAKARKT